MAVACGHNCTFVVTQQGALFVFGQGSSRQLGLSCTNDQLAPILLASATSLGSPVCMVAAGKEQTFCITTAGSVFSWGQGFLGTLGHNDYLNKRMPTLLDPQNFAGAKVLLVSCGIHHTMLLTDRGSVWTCGDGSWGKLGHGDFRNYGIFSHVLSTACTAPMPRISMIAAGLYHSVALASDGRVFSWGRAVEGRLGLYPLSNHQYTTKEARPRLVKTLQNHCVEMVAAGNDHTVVLTVKGVVFSWGVGACGQLGLGDTENRYIPEEIRAIQGLAPPKFAAVACGRAKTALLTTEGVLYTCGRSLSLGDTQPVHPNRELAVHFVDVLEPSIVNGHDYGAAPIVSVVVGIQHMCALDIYGRMYTWGKAVDSLYSEGLLVERRPTGALGHPNMLQSLLGAPRLLDFFQDALQVGCFKTILPSHAMAFCMGTHDRLCKVQGQKDNSLVYYMPSCLLQHIVQEIVLAPCLPRHAGQGLKKLFGFR